MIRFALKGFLFLFLLPSKLLKTNTNSNMKTIARRIQCDVRVNASQTGKHMEVVILEIKKHKHNAFLPPRDIVFFPIRLSLSQDLDQASSTYSQSCYSSTFFCKCKNNHFFHLIALCHS